MPRILKFSEAIQEALDQQMALDPEVFLMGLGVPDPKGIFGTTLGLQEKYGPDRVMDMPLSENAMMGVVIGAALEGMKPVMIHQRSDFFLLALDQLVNNASKWFYMFAEQMKVPLVVRLMIGRGWGQGVQHSQTFHAFFSHIPGLKVVMPTTPYDAKGLLVSSIEDPNPVVFIEHRWLHTITGDVPKELYRIPLGKADRVIEGDTVTIVSLSHMTLEARRAAAILQKEGVSVEVIDVRTLKPLDKETILTSVAKTGRLIVADPDWKSGSFAGEILALVAEEAFAFLQEPPVRITYPDALPSASWSIANHFYPTANDIVAAVWKLLGKETSARRLLEEVLMKKMNAPLDVPDPTFTGPF